jgi:hypothetical protein
VMGKSFSLNADRDSHIAVCPGSWPRRSFGLRKLVVWANHAHLHVLRKEATTPGMPHPQPRELQEGDGESMDNHGERHETDEFLEIGAY